MFNHSNHGLALTTAFDMNPSIRSEVTSPLYLRVLRFTLHALPFAFTVQLVVEVFAIPTFKEMYTDFGSALPRFAEYMMALRFLWLALSLFGAVLSVGVLSGMAPSLRRISLLAGLALFEFVLAQALFVAMFQPVFELAQPTAAD